MWLSFSFTWENIKYHQTYPLNKPILSDVLTLKTHIDQSSFFTFTVVVCYGTQNVLSVTGTSELQYNLMKQRYTGCEIVMGNLEITMMEHNRDFSFLQVRL